MTRRDLLKHFGTMTAAAIALPIDIDKLIWTPKPIITVPALPTAQLSEAQWWVFEHEGAIDLATGIRMPVGRWVELPPGQYPPSPATALATAFATATAIGIVR